MSSDDMTNAPAPRSPDPVAEQSTSLGATDHISRARDANRNAAMDVGDAQGPLLQRLKGMQSIWILGVLVLITAFFAIKAPSQFMTGDNMINIGQNLAIWAVLAVGMTFVIITSGIDLAVGTLMTFCAVMAGVVMVFWNCLLYTSPSPRD